MGKIVGRVTIQLHRKIADNVSLQGVKRSRVLRDNPGFGSGDDSFAPLAMIDFGRLQLNAF